MKTQRVRYFVSTAGAVALTLGTAACGSSTADAGGAVELQIASTVGGNTIVGSGVKAWADAIEEASDGSITFKIAESGSLLAATDTLPGVADGRADVGVFTYIYHPAELPLNHVINIPFTTENVPAQEKTFMELYEGSEAYQQEWEQQGVRLLYSNVVTPTLLGCKEPIESLDDLDGRSVRAAGLVAEAFEVVGANVATIPITEVRDAVSKGVVDCWSTLSLDLATDFDLQDETKYIYDFGYGNYGQWSVAINSSSWNSLSEEQQDLVLEQSAKMPEVQAGITTERIAEGCEAVTEAGAEIIPLSPELQAEWKDAIGTRIEDKFLEMSPDAAEFLDDYRSTLAENEAEFSDFEPPLAKCEQG